MYLWRYPLTNLPAARSGDFGNALRTLVVVIANSRLTRSLDQQDPRHDINLTHRQTQTLA